MQGFQFPLGVYPVEEFQPKPGYTAEFEPADGGDAESDWEEWPDRYMFDVVVPANRLRGLCLTLLSLLPTRVYPILDILGEDAYREVDPYIAYDPIGFDQFIELMYKHEDWLFECGLVGFGAMSDDPFLYVYVDEHKILTVRAQSDLKDVIERALEAFDAPLVDTLLSVDTVAHEHRSVLDPAPGSLVEEEILEELIDHWRLQINVDREHNLRDDGKELGVTGWRCLVRLSADAASQPVYGHVWLRAACLEDAEWGALDALAEEAKVDLEAPAASAMVILADRFSPEMFQQSITALGAAEEVVSSTETGVCVVRVLRDDQS
jgi:hypothetical protein